MARHVIGILILIVTLAAVLVLYRTFPVPTHTGTLAGVSLRLDYATTDATRERGLGGRANVPNGYGMLFIFPKEDYYGFWMKDTLVPLDIFWLDDALQVVSMATDVATSTYPRVFYSSVPVKYVLETAAGFAHVHGVATGTPLVLKNGLKNLPNVSR